MEAHTTSDDPTRYRNAEELEQWARLDPIARYRLLLEHDGLLDEAVQRKTQARAEASTRRLREAVVDARDPDPEELFAHVFAEPTPALLAQREVLRAEVE